MMCPRRVLHPILQMRKLTGYQKTICYILGIFVSLFSLYTAAFGVLAPFLQRSHPCRSSSAHGIHALPRQQKALTEGSLHAA